MRRVAFVVSPLFAALSFAHAEPIDDLASCQKVRDAKQHLACYDRIAPQVISFDQGAKTAAAQNRQEANAKAAKEKEVLEKQAAAQEAASSKAALDALKMFQARVRTGISYRDYSGPLASAKFTVESYSESTAAKKRPEFTSALREALAHYEMAGRVWKQKFDLSRVTDYMWDTDLANKLIVDYYPRMSAARTSSGSLAISDAIHVIWDAASGAISKASALLGE